MIEFLIALAGAAIAFAALIPLLKTGGQMIAAFMRRTEVLRYSFACTAQLCGLFAGALLAVSIAQGSNEAPLRLLGAVLMLGTVYAVNWIIHKTILKDLS